MKKIIFNLDALEQMYSNGHVNTLNSIFRCMNDEIENGNIVVISKKNDTNPKEVFFYETSTLKQFQNGFLKKNMPSLKTLLENR